MKKHVFIVRHTFDPDDVKQLRRYLRIRGGSQSIRIYIKNTIQDQMMHVGDELRVHDDFRANQRASRQGIISP